MRLSRWICGTFAAAAMALGLTVAAPAAADIDATIIGLEIPDQDQIQITTDESVESIVTYTLVDPARVIVDFRETARGGIPQQRMVDDGAIKGITFMHMRAGDVDLERMIVLTKPGTGYAEIIIGNKLILNLYAPDIEEDLGPDRPEAAPMASAAESVEPMQEGFRGELVPLAGGRTLVWPSKYPATVNPAHRANKTLDITITEYQGATEITVPTNGNIADFEDFNLPMHANRVVLDMWHMTGKYEGGTSYDVNSAEVQRLRVGQHKDKFRIVADLNPPRGGLRNYSVEKEETAVKVYIFSEKLDLDANPDAYSMHTVQSGETLSSLAKDYYGSSRDWRRILSVNRDRLSDPQAHVDRNGNLNLPPGDVLRVPIRAQ